MSKQLKLGLDYDVNCYGELLHLLISGWEVVAWRSVA